MVPVLIGCPPGKRLALNTSYTIQYNYQENKHYFDCMYKDPEMPCFFFRDSVYPQTLASPPRVDPAGPHLLPPISLRPGSILTNPLPRDSTVFYPIFSIQDLVTGDSGKFQGR